MIKISKAENVKRTWSILFFYIKTFVFYFYLYFYVNMHFLCIYFSNFYLLCINIKKFVCALIKKTASFDGSLIVFKE